MNLFDQNTNLFVYNETVVEPLVLTATLCLGTILMVLPRRYAVVPFILLASFLPISQRVAIAEIDFNMVRILVLFGFARFFLRGDYEKLQTVEETMQKISPFAKYLWKMFLSGSNSGEKKGIIST